MSQEHKEKLSNAHKNSPKCKKWLKTLHNQNKGKHFSPNTEIKKGDFREKSIAWKGGRTMHNCGYVWIHSPKHPNKDCRNYILEHRLVVERFIERYLDSNETVHHINKIKADNRPENLMAFASSGSHTAFHHNPENVQSKDIIFDGRLLHVSPI